MKLSISNIAWTAENDVEMYSFLHRVGFGGVEIAPTRIFPDDPYEKLLEAKKWAMDLNLKYNLTVSSMQSIWYGHTEKIFESEKERKLLVDYTKKAIDFAEVIGCKNLVFGNPKNRNISDLRLYIPIAIDFFKELGEYAKEHNTVIALEPNPIIYNTNFMNYTKEAVDMASKIDSDGIKVNIDLGAIIYNEEDINYLKQIPEFINHIHISEPSLNLIKTRNIHKDLFKILASINYDRFVSIEMGNKNNIEQVKDIVKYVKSIFA